MPDDNAKQNDAGLVPATHVRIEALAEQVEQELGPLVAPDQRKQVAHRIAMRIDKSTYPPGPELLEAYEKYAPGSAKALIDKYLEGIDHDRALDLREEDRQDRVVDILSDSEKAERSGEREGRITGIFALMLILGAVLMAGWLGFVSISVMLIIAASAGIVVQLIRGRNNGTADDQQPNRNRLLSWFAGRSED